MKAKYLVCFDDFNWERFVSDCGAEFLRLEPRLDGAFDLYISGSENSISQFSSDLSWKPEQVWK